MPDSLRDIEVAHISSEFNFQVRSMSIDAEMYKLKKGDNQTYQDAKRRVDILKWISSEFWKAFNRANDIKYKAMKMLSDNLKMAKEIKDLREEVEKLKDELRDAKELL